MTSALTRRITVAVMATLAAPGCQLAFDLEDYPYSPVLVFDADGLEDAGGDTDDGPPDAGPDAPPDAAPDVPPDVPPDPEGPKLIFTEFLVDSDFLADGSSSDETGEFFEVYNAGDDFANMALVRLDFSDPTDDTFNESWILQLDTQVMLDPGGYFLIYRGDTPNGDFAANLPQLRRAEVNGTGLSNSGKFRRADLVYGGSDIMDTLYWDNGDMLQCTIDTDVISCPEDNKRDIIGTEGASFFLRSNYLELQEQGNFATWCKSARVYTDGLSGWPGESNPSECR